MTDQTEFPDFPADAMPAIPQGFRDTSWHNDSCPNFTSDALGLRIWVDYPDPAQRELSAYRFALEQPDVDPRTALAIETDHWAEIVAAIETHAAERAEAQRMRAVLYTSDNERPVVLPLDRLIKEFDASRGWANRCNATDMVYELDSRGWYQGSHENGRYLVLDIAKFGLTQTDNERSSR